MRDRKNWKTGLGLAAGLFAATAAGATESQTLDPQAMADIEGLIDYIVDEVPVVPNQTSTDAQIASIKTLTPPLADLLDGCYGETTIADYAIALHIGLQTAVRSHSEGLYVSREDEAFTTLTGHIQDAAQWIPHVDEAFTTAHPQAQDLMDRLNQSGVLETADVRITLDAITAHNVPETQTYRIENVHNAPLEYYGPYSSMMSIPEFAENVRAMISNADHHDPETFWRHVPTLPPPACP